MKYEKIAPARRQATNVSLDREMVSEAKALGLNLSRVCEQGLKKAVAEAREHQWIEENWDAIQATNAWVEKNGLPLGKYRVF